MAISKIPIEQQTVKRSDLSDWNPFAIAYDQLRALHPSDDMVGDQIMKILVDFYNGLKNK